MHLFFIHNGKWLFSEGDGSFTPLCLFVLFPLPRMLFLIICLLAKLHFEWFLLQEAISEHSNQFRSLVYTPPPIDQPHSQGSLGNVIKGKDKHLLAGFVTECILKACYLSD